MRSFVFLVCVVVLAGCSGLAGEKLIGKPAPDPRLFHLEDGSQSFLSDYRGKKVALLFWSTTCNSSRPIVKRLGDFASREASNPKVKIIAISLDKADDLQAVKDRVTYEGLHSIEQMFSGNEDYDEAYQYFRGERLPYIVVIDEKGTVIAADTDDSIVYRSM